jgi:hypothetical protein
MAVTPQLMSSPISTHPTSSYSRPFVTTNNGTQHVQGTGTTPRPQDEYELSWTGNDPPHFVHIVHADPTLSQPKTLAIPATTYDNDESTTPVVRPSGGTTGGDRAVEPHAEGADTLTTRHPDPQPVSLAQSNLS